MPALVQPRAEKRKLIEEELNCSMKVFLLIPAETVKNCKFPSRPRGVASG